MCIAVQRGTTRCQGRALGGCNNITPLKKTNASLSSAGGFLLMKFQCASEDPKTAASDLRGRMRFARETTRCQGQALGGMQQHHATEEDECLVVNKGLYWWGSQDKERKTFYLPLMGILWQSSCGVFKLEQVAAEWVNDSHASHASESRSFNHCNLELELLYIIHNHYFQVSCHCLMFICCIAILVVQNW